MAELLDAGFIGGTYDRAAQLRTDPDWLAAQLAAPGTRFVVFVADRTMVDVSDTARPAIAYVSAESLWDLMPGSKPVFLGFEGDRAPVFAVQYAESDIETAAQHIPPDVMLIDLRSLAMQGTMPAHQMSFLAQARSLCHWHGRHRFCANCGSGTVQRDGGYRRHCNNCNADHFPRTDPVAIMIVVDGPRMLLGRSPHFMPNMYSALAGFVEPGETIEQAGRREIFEEAGIEVGEVRYVASQPWPFASSLMIGLIGIAENRDITMDPDELEDVRWFERADVELMLEDRHPDGLKTPMKMAIAHHLVLAALGLE